VICHLIDELYRQADAAGQEVRIAQKCDKDLDLRDERTACCDTNEKLATALVSGEFQVFAGTTWLWARDELQHSVDTLFVDEAGQLSLASVLAVTGAAANLVLLGDPQQLAQPSQAAHPPGADVSALEHVLDGAATMPPDAGLLLDRTWRMHPTLCSFTSETFYDGRLACIRGLENQSVLGDEQLGGSGLRVIPIPHQANANSSPEEAAAISTMIGELLQLRWRDRDRNVRALAQDDVLVVTPYNAQVRAIDAALAADGLRGIRVGTVDKFQGREAPVVVYSMASSSAADAPRGIPFLYDLHRLNVATSRAQALAILVASPELIRVMCGTPRQMVLANALCEAWSAARSVQPS